MGCSAVPKFKRKIPTCEELKTEIRVAKQIKVDPGIFIQENTKRFLDVWRLGPAIHNGPYYDVHTCVNRETHVKRCAKIYRKDLITNETARASILIEIDLQKTIDHPNIVKFLEYFEDVRRIYLVYEFCKGGDLLSEVIAQKQFSEARAAIVLEQLFSILTYLHGQGIMHRTLRPECILLEEFHNLSHIKISHFEHASRLEPIQPLTIKPGQMYYASPEILDEIYTEKSDIWSCGVILYLLLAGYPPFNGRTDEEIAEKIRIGFYTLENDPWDEVSENAKDLIKKLICPEKSRITASQAMRHPFFSKTSKESPNISQIGNALSSLQSFQSTNKLREAVQTFITSQCISNKETKEMREVFQSMDKNGDGKLSRSELLDKYKIIMGEEDAEEEVTKMMAHVDSDNSGFIDYTEFLKATIDSKILLSTENLKKSFDLFDRDGDGTIGISELKDILEGGMASNDKVWKEMVKEFDKNGDGMIDLEEFRSIILSKL